MFLPLLPALTTLSARPRMITHRNFEEPSLESSGRACKARGGTSEGLARDEAQTGRGRPGLIHWHLLVLILARMFSHNLYAPAHPIAIFFAVYFHPNPNAHPNARTCTRCRATPIPSFFLVKFILADSSVWCLSELISALSRSQSSPRLFVHQWFSTFHTDRLPRTPRQGDWDSGYTTVEAASPDGYSGSFRLQVGIDRHC